LCSVSDGLIAVVESAKEVTAFSFDSVKTFCGCVSTSAAARGGLATWGTAFDDRANAAKAAPIVNDINIKINLEKGRMC